MRTRRRSHRGLQLMALTFSWALLAIGAGLIAAWGLMGTRRFLAIGVSYVLAGLVLQGIRLASEAYDNMRRERHAADREAGSRAASLPGSDAPARDNGGSAPTAPALGGKG